MAASLLPSPRTPDPHRAPSLRWGIMGPGWIAQRFTATLQKHTSQQVVAVGSRNQARADEFAAQHSVPTAYGSYEQLLADPGIDIVYIATPHTEHYACALAALAAGKHVLVEKPLGVNAVQAAAIAESASTAGLFAGEAMWTKFLPKFDVVRQIIDEGMLGRVHTVIADHGEHFTTDHRIYDPALAGGPLLDLGTYPVVAGTFHPRQARVRPRQRPTRQQSSQRSDLGDPDSCRRQPSQPAHDHPEQYPDRRRHRRGAKPR